MITEVAEKWATNEERMADGLAIRAYLQGLLCGESMKNIGGLLSVAQVHLDVDENGDYEHFFVVETEDGHMLRISVDLVV